MKPKLDLCASKTLIALSSSCKMITAMPRCELDEGVIVIRRVVAICEKLTLWRGSQMRKSHIMQLQLRLSEMPATLLPTFPIARFPFALVPSSLPLPLPPLFGAAHAPCVLYLYFGPSVGEGGRAF
eukprot:scaffold268291_cov41-Tisochrysis_lutea.AAC.1